MVTVTNGMSVPISILLAGGAQDAKGRNIKFEQEKDSNIPVYTSKRKDGSIYSFTFPDNANATVTITESSNLKEQRRKGFPVPKDEADKLDKEIKEEDLKAKAAAKAAATGKSLEDAEKEVVKEEREAEAEQKEADREQEAGLKAQETERGRPRGGR